MAKCALIAILISCESEPATPELTARLHSKAAYIEIMGYAHQNEGYTPEFLHADYVVRGPNNESAPLLYAGRVRLDFDDDSEKIPLLSTPFKIDGRYFVRNSDYSITWEEVNPLKKR